uniref:MAX dimerization protein MGA n=1 Tax=Cynoglossus semilaevis TaxID=244447 RepID=A0A3P8VXA8_CYNSE
MASKRKQKDMVLRQERATTPAAATAAEHPAACSILSTTQKAKEGGWKLRSHQNVTNKERDMTGKEVSMSPVLSPVKQPTSLHSQQEPLSPVSFCKGIKVTLDNNSMWNEFYRCRTEMILTKQGSRMFPYCRFRISGLQSAMKYSLIMDIQPLDNSCYKWTGSSWQAAGKAEGHKKSPPFAHPESPSTGEHWMQNPVSFYRLKLTNSISEGNIFLHPMHRYLPRLHIIPTDKATKDIKLTGPSVVTFTFTQTEFMAVTAYQNSKFAQLKVDYNPFAKGLKEELSGSMGQKLKLNSGKDLHKEEPNRTNPLKTNLKSLLANHKRRSLKLADSKSLPPGDTTNKIQSTARVPEESFSGSPPAQKLFSELIREAHVSLQRCNMEEISANSTSRRTKLTHMEDENQQTPSANKSDCVLMPRKLKTTTRQCLDVEIPKKTDICEVVNVSQKSCAETDHQPKLESSSKVNVEKKRCTAALPLPALARFLKQHSTKSKKSNIGPPPTVTPDSKAQISDKKVPEGNLVDIVKESNSFTNDPTCEPVKVTIQPTSLSSGTAENIEPTVPDAGNSFDSISTSENPNFRPTDIDGPPVLLLHVNKSPQTRAITESSTLLPNSPTIRSVSSLPDPECSSFTFEPMSPASSPEPLPALADSFTLELESTLSQQGQKPGTSDLSTMSEGPSTSVFQWHTILQPALSIAASDSISSFQIAEQSLPFPGELSPLVLQLPLSPTFSSIDGDVLSPAPSLTDLVQFFSVSDELGMEVEFSNSGLTPAPAPAPASATASCSPTSKSEENAPEPCQDVEPPKKSCKRRKISCMQKPSSNGQDQRVDGSYANMQPNMEEVEEQLFVSFTSKVKLHLYYIAFLFDFVKIDQKTNSEVLKIYRYEKNLLRDLKLVKHRQVIHPVLQEVGIKLNLLDPTLAIDLQYLGVHLPIPPPGVGLEPLTQELTSSQGTSAAFVSRTGKTTDVTLIKGWREKFSPPEAPSSSDLPKKNLSAFCSDMLDEYLENEGKLIDERAASFCQPQEEQVPYELPAQSTSYVRTLDSVLKKHGPPTSDLISGFIPPSKRPKVSPPERKTRDNLKGSKLTRMRQKPASPQYKTSGQTLPPLQDDPSGLEPIESDTEVSRTNRQQDKTPVMTRALLRQKDLEDGVVWEGQPRTSITKERATIALTSLFTLMLGCSRAPPCLNDYCRLGCICSSLAYSYRIGHCGRPQCMFGCSCLKQKVVLLKNLDCPDLSPLKQGSNKKSKRRKRRMKMAYGKNNNSQYHDFSQPAERVHVLWKKENEDLDPEPTYIPQQHSQTNLTRPVHLQQCLDQTRSCARVRAYTGKGRSQKLKAIVTLLFPCSKTRTERCCHFYTAAEQSQPPPSVQPPIPQTELPSKPSKRLIILAECKWTSEDDRNQVLKSMCEAMALDRLNTQFWVKDYLITPISQTSKEAETEEHMTNKDETSENRQNQVEESDTNEEQGSTSQQNNSGSETSGQELRKEAKTEDSLALPLLTGISPAGFLSAKVKQPGGTDHVVEVNGKLYPLAKIQLGKMGALHPANRLAAYLTGRVGSIKKQLQTQTISPTTQTTTTITTSPATSTSTGTSSQPQSMVPGTLPSTSSTGKKRLSVCPTVGEAVYTLPRLPLQTPAVTVQNQKSTTTSATLPSAAPASSLSGFQSFSVSPLPSPLSPGSGFLSQKGTCTFKILPASTKTESIVIKCSPLPLLPPEKLPLPNSPTHLKLKPPESTAPPFLTGGSVPSHGPQSEFGTTATPSPASDSVGLIETNPKSPISSSSPPSTGGGACFLDPGVEPEGGPEGLKTLLNELVFLNQNTVSTATKVEMSSEAVNVEGEGCVKVNCTPQKTEGAMLQEHTEGTPSRTTNGNTTKVVLTPPPLLQMKVGEAISSDSTPSHKATAGEGAGGHDDASPSWRPMPRLVPLGVKGAPPI